MHDDAKKFEMVTVPLGELEPLFARALDPARVDHLEADIRENGLKEPLLIASDTIPPERWYVVDGLHRLEALKRLGWSATHAVWAPALVPEDALARVLWRRTPTEVERVWTLLLRTARTLEVAPEEARRFLLDFVQALQRARPALGGASAYEVTTLARATLEEMAGKSPSADSSLVGALEFLARDEARLVALRLKEAGVPDWPEYLHGRLRLLVLPANFFEKAVRNGVSASMLFLLKAAADEGAPSEIIEEVLEEPETQTLEELSPWLRHGAKADDDPAAELVAKTRRLVRLIRKKLARAQSPQLVERISHVLAEAEQLLEEATAS